MHLLICLSICIHCCFLSVIIIVILFPSKYIQRVASFRSETSALVCASSVVRLKGKICSYPELCKKSPTYFLRWRNALLTLWIFFFFGLNLALQKNTDGSWRYLRLRQDKHHKSIISKPLAYPSSSRAICEHLGDRCLTQGYLGGALKVSWHLSLVLTPLKFYPHWGLNWEPSATRKHEKSNLFCTAWKIMQSCIYPVQ